MGIDAGALLRGGLAGLTANGPEAETQVNAALSLAAAMAAGVRSGRDKLTIELHPALATLGLWLEQLIAESLGKDGTGVAPVVGQPLADPAVFGDDRLSAVNHPPTPAPPAQPAASHPVVHIPRQTARQGEGRSVSVTVAVSPN